jgi:type IV secretory pathway VirB3-like protein
MDGRLVTIALTLLLPAVLIGVTAAYYSLNPVAVLGLISVMVGGVLYLLSYSRSF